MRHKITLLFALVLCTWVGLMAVTDMPSLNRSMKPSHPSQARESMSPFPAAAMQSMNATTSQWRAPKRADANVEMKSLTYKEADAITYTWYDEIGAQHTSKLTETAKDPRQMIALLKTMYTNKNIPGPKYSAWSESVTREDPVDYNGGIEGGWNIEERDYTPNEEGYSVALVAMKNDADTWNSNDYTYDWYLNYRYYSLSYRQWYDPDTSYSGFRFTTEAQLVNYFKNNFDSIMFLTDGIRIGSNEDFTRGTIFNYNGTLNRFFFLGKGQARKKADYVLQRQSEDGKIYGEVFPFKTLFEQFSPTSTDSGVETSDYYYKLTQDKEAYSVIHDCGSVPGYAHYFSMSGKKGTTANNLTNLQFYCPDYRLLYWETAGYKYVGLTESENTASGYDATSRVIARIDSTYSQWSRTWTYDTTYYYQCYNKCTVDGRKIDAEVDVDGNSLINTYRWFPTSAKWANYNATYAPLTMLYGITLTVDSVATVYEDNDEIATINTDWISSLQDRFDKANVDVDEIFTLYIVTTDSLGNENKIAIEVTPGTIYTVLQEYTDTVARYDYSYEITYVVTGRPYDPDDADEHYGYGVAESNYATSIVPGRDTKENLRLVFDHYESDYDIKNERNNYRNYFALRNGLAYKLKAKNLLDNDTISLYRYPMWETSTSLPDGTLWAEMALQRGESQSYTVYSPDADGNWSTDSKTTKEGYSINYNITYYNDLKDNIVDGLSQSGTISFGSAQTIYKMRCYYNSNGYAYDTNGGTPLYLYVTELPSSTQTTTLNGKTYYKIGLTYFSSGTYATYYYLEDTPTVLTGDEDIDITNVLLADYFKENVQYNDHPVRYGYRAYAKATNLEIGDASDATVHSNTTFVPVFKTAQKLNGFYTWDQIYNIDTVRTLQTEVGNANVETQITDNGKIYKYEIVRGENAKPTDFSHIVEAYQRKTDGSGYAELYGDINGFKDTYTVGTDEVIWADKQDICGVDMKNDTLIGLDAYYARRITTFATGRLDGALYNTYGADMMRTDIGSVEIIEDKSDYGPVHTYYKSDTNIVAAAMGNLDSIQIQYITPELHIKGILPEELKDYYEPYMFRVWIKVSEPCEVLKWRYPSTIDKNKEILFGGIRGITKYDEELFQFVPEYGYATTTFGENDLKKRVTDDDGNVTQRGVYYNGSTFGVVAGSNVTYYVRFYYKLKETVTERNVAAASAPLKASLEDDSQDPLPMYYVVETPMTVDWDKVPTGVVETLTPNAEVVDVTYFNIQGMRSSKPFDGVNIVVTRYSDGSSRTTKVVK